MRIKLHAFLPYFRVMTFLISLFALAVILTAVPVSAQSEFSGDGLTLEERSTIFEQVASVIEPHSYRRALLIVDSTRPTAFFGMYRLSMMTEPGWTLFGRTISWAIDHRDPATIKIWLATYNGTLDPNNRDQDGRAAYDYLTNVMGFLSGNIHAASQSTIETGDFTGYDLVVYTNQYGRDASNVMAQNIPFVTVAARETDELGIGTGETMLYEQRDYIFIADESHEITSPLDTGRIDLPEVMWMNAAYAADNGVALVFADSSYYFSPVWVEIDMVHNVMLGEVLPVNINITNTPAWFQMSGFDFLIYYDPTMLELLSITQGVLPGDCQWEYFNYTIDQNASCGGDPCPDGTFRLVGIIDPGNPVPDISCFADSSEYLISLEFGAFDDISNECQYSMIRPIWYDCGDNVIASATGDTLSISRDILLEDVWSILTSDSTFPTDGGAPSECDISSTILRRINYKIGGFDIQCADSIDSRGDINQNEIAYEIADFVMFANYLLYGIQALEGSYEGFTEAAIAASDINADGLCLTLDDIVYLMRVIVGEVYPYAKDLPLAVGDTAVFVQDSVNKVIHMNYPDSVNGVYLVFEGDVEPWGWADSTRPFDGIYTRVLMTRFFTGHDSTIFYQDSLLYYTGEGILVAALAAYDGITPIPTRIEGTPEGCCQNRGNVDGLMGGLPNIADLVYLVSYVFVGGDIPPCIEEADISGDLYIDITDIVRLVNYMFNAGPEPPPCN